jgi:hypothetical protein
MQAEAQMKQRLAWWLAALVPMGQLSNAGCSGGDPNGTTQTGGTSATSAPSESCGLSVMAQSCALAGCHASSPGNPPEANLDLSTSVLGDGHQLVNAAAQGSTCVGTSSPPPVIIDPRHPTSSLLYDKLQSQPVCGSPMPYGRPPLSDTDQQCILDWIDTVPGVMSSKP